MTTIVYRDGVLAGDTMTVHGNTYEGDTRKVDRTEDGILYGAGGRLHDCERFKRWVQGGMQGDLEVRDESFQGIVIKPDGKVTLYDEGSFPIDITAPFYAIGTGKDLALGAMCVGANALQAMAVAMKMDVCTSQNVNYVFLDGCNPMPEPDKSETESEPKPNGSGYPLLRDEEETQPEPVKADPETQTVEGAEEDEDTSP